MALRKFIDTDQYDWSSITLRLNGVKVTTLQSVSVTKEVNKVPIYNMGRHYVDVLTGNVIYNGNLTILQSDLNPLLQIDSQLIEADIDMITGLPFVIGLTLEKNDKIEYYNIENVHFTSWDLTFNQGDNSGIVTLPFIASTIKSISGI